MIPPFVNAKLTKYRLIYERTAREGRKKALEHRAALAQIEEAEYQAFKKWYDTGKELGFCITCTNTMDTCNCVWLACGDI